MDNQPQIDWGAIIRLVMAGMLGAAGKSIWVRLSMAPRPARELHDVAYIRQQVKKIMEEDDSQGHQDAYARETLRELLAFKETVCAQMEGFERRFEALERRRGAGD